VFLILIGLTSNINNIYNQYPCYIALYVWFKKPNSIARSQSWMMKLTF